MTLLRWAGLNGNRVLELHQAGQGYRLSVVVLDGPTRRQCGGFDLTAAEFALLLRIVAEFGTTIQEHAA
jgi:hypothetical protein